MPLLPRFRLPLKPLIPWLRWLVPIIALLLAFIEVSSQFKLLDIEAVRLSFKQLSLSNTLLLIVVGLLVTGSTVLYDLLLQYWLRFDLKVGYVVKYAWLANILNNVAGLAGMTGAGIRYLALHNAGVAKRQAVSYSGLILLCMPVGLSLLSNYVLIFHRDLLSKLAIPMWLSLSILAVVSLYWLAFLLVSGGSNALHRRLLADTPALTFLQRLSLLLVSLLDWVAIVGLLLLCFKLVGVSLPFGAFIAAFTIAATLGWVSMIPGGLGVFESSILILLVGVVDSSASVLAALLLYRIVYYFVPFLLGIHVLASFSLVKEGGNLDELMQRFQAHPLLQFTQIPLHFIGRISTQVLAYFTFGAGLVLLLSAIFPSVSTRLDMLESYIPSLAREGFHLSSVIAGTLLLGLARGISAGQRGAYYITQIVLLLGIVFSLLKGLDYEVVVVLLVLSLLLRINRAAFHHQGYSLTSRRSLHWLLAGISALVVVALLGEVLYGTSYFTEKLGQWRHTAGAERYVRALVVMLLTFLGWLGWTWFSMPLPASMQRPDQEALSQAQRFYQDVANTGYSYLTYLGDKSLFFNQNKTALIQYGHKRNHLIALGDPAAATSSDLADAIHEFRNLADTYNRTAVFYQVDEANVHHYLDAGFVLLKLGETASIVLRDFSLIGHKGQKWRGALNHGARAGLSFEIATLPLEENIWQELQAVSEVWMREQRSAEKGFSLGRFEREFLAHCRSFALIKQNGKIVAFASVTPDFSQKDEFRIDLMRYLPDTPNGTMDFLFVNLIQYAAQAGYQRFDLGVAPLAGVGETIWSRREERLIRLIYQYGNHFYNFKGLRDYKDKFNPQWRSIYLAYPRRASLLSILVDVSALISGGYRQMFRKS
ncbi:MAG TPA: bifunctional lysylphosphatidylglycerol flippase/synthetase MprF [Alcaligenaceae bacterium]|nr:bifunctional lysylphosphatidylglycerol flippase/synthetase MprF [Alcaligenaceae bacterium]